MRLPGIGPLPTYSLLKYTFSTFGQARLPGFTDNQGRIREILLYSHYVIVQI